jgi:hypothetical protein
MKNSPAVSEVAVVVRWPAHAANSVAVQVHRFLAEKRLTATWAVERAKQIDELPGRERPDVAVLIGRDAAAPAIGDDAASRLEELAAAGLATAVVQLPKPAERGQFERRLKQLGVALVVSDAGAAGTVHPLPFGLWQLTPAAVAPAARRWFGLLPGKVRSALPRPTTAPAVASIDVGRLAKGGSPHWRPVERLLDEVAAAISTGAARETSLAEIAARLTRAATARPQRSILRAA